MPRQNRRDDQTDRPLPLPAHSYDPDRTGGRAGRRCKCGLPERNRVHHVPDVPSVERRTP